MSLPKENPGKIDFDIWYEKTDPWGIHNSVIDLARIKKFSEFLEMPNSQEA